MNNNIDLEKAQALLCDGYTCVLCKAGKVYTSQETGIRPMVSFLSDGVDLKGFSAADKIVGKAAAMLFVLAGVVSVYAPVMSAAAVEYFRRNHVQYAYDELTDAIINRQGNGLCPMEQAVHDLNDPAAAFLAVKLALRALSGRKERS